ncbi:MAG: type I restriction enzyme HsdR N-terminal domain-containing protein [Paludibacteraceae bacterium]|nr:type I restriction enzyme HsdR N-terminal domain-containing protein [Paludibacteraceae bacterium]
MNTRLLANKQQVFCDWRKKWVRLTPEENVRQQVLHYLVEQLGYPASLIGVEVAIEVGAGVTKRCDAVVYTSSLQPLMLLEFKAPEVALTQTTLDQAAVYNTTIRAPYLVLANGRQTVVAHLTDQNPITFLNSIPAWSQL